MSEITKDLTPLTSSDTAESLTLFLHVSDGQLQLYVKYKYLYKSLSWKQVDLTPPFFSHVRATALAEQQELLIWSDWRLPLAKVASLLRGQEASSAHHSV